uniref:RAP domain-containing protein n=1 Tax=Mantoniella antarctica TaxID=81844 RepID=A0A7S0SUM9_9CHLO|mmetsp:Transcript_35445/g.88675  ORF Transcript_35445/g.88675 Transcript_35445/m.88675 type:complete len:398 (+) Transcript_35445:675-1868(+)
MDIYLPEQDIAVEFDGPTHYYHNIEDSSSSQDARLTRTIKTELRDFLLAKQCAKVVTVPYFEWGALKSLKERKAYVEDKLAKEVGIEEQAMDEVEEHFLAKRRTSSEERRRLEEERKVVTAAAAATAAMDQGNGASEKVQHKAVKPVYSATAKPRAAFDITATDASDTALKEASREEAAQTARQEAAAAAGAPPIFAGKTAPAMERWRVKEAKKARKQAAIDAALAELGVDDDILALANPGIVMRGAAEEKEEEEEEEGHIRAGNALLGKQAEDEKASARRRKKGGKGMGEGSGGSTGIKAVSVTAGGRKGGGKHRTGRRGAPDGGNVSLTASLIQDAAQSHGLATLYVVCVRFTSCAVATRSSYPSLCCSRFAGTSSSREDLCYVADSRPHVYYII